MSWGAALLGGLLLAAAHRGMVWCVVPGFSSSFSFFGLSILNGVWDALLGLGESFAIYEVWSIAYAAGFFGMLEFIVFRALMLWCLTVASRFITYLLGYWVALEPL